MVCVATRLLVSFISHLPLPPLASQFIPHLPPPSPHISLVCLYLALIHLSFASVCLLYISRSPPFTSVHLSYISCLPPSGPHTSLICLHLRLIYPLFTPVRLLFASICLSFTSIPLLFISSPCLPLLPNTYGRCKDKVAEQVCPPCCPGHDRRCKGKSWNSAS